MTYLDSVFFLSFFNSDLSATSATWKASFFFSTCLARFSILGYLVWSCPPGPGLQLLFCCKPSVGWHMAGYPCPEHRDAPFSSPHVSVTQGQDSTAQVSAKLHTRSLTPLGYMTVTLTSLWVIVLVAVCVSGLKLSFVFIFIFIVIQLQLYVFSPHPSTPPQPNPPSSPHSTLPLDFVHVSFIVVLVMCFLISQVLREVRPQRLSFGGRNVRFLKSPFAWQF